MIGSLDSVAPLPADRIAAIVVDIDRFRATRRPTIFVDEQELLLTASAGVALAGPGAFASTVMRDASAALHCAQRRGRGSIELFVPALRAQVVARQ